jgi:hypothetical protein
LGPGTGTGAGAGGAGVGGGGGGGEGGGGGPGGGGHGGGSGGVGGAGAIGSGYTGQKAERAERWRKWVAAGGRGGIEQFIIQEAARQGIDPRIALAVARSEGLGNPVANAPSEQSYSAFQLNMARGAVGDQMLRQTGIDPSLPENEKAAIAYALRHVRQHGWGAWMGARGQGITGHAGVGPGGYQPDYKSLVQTATPPGGGGGGTGNQQVSLPQTTGAIQAALGDSIAVGLAANLGIPGDAITGKTPKEIYDRLTGHLKKYSGQTVAVASGSNGACAQALD